MSDAEQDQIIRLEAIRQEALRVAQEARLKAEQLAKEEARKLAEKLAEEEAELQARNDAAAFEITLPIHHVYARDEMIAEIVIRHGALVSDLSAACYKAARLPFQPRLLRKSGEKLHRYERLIDARIFDGELLLAELAVILTSSKDCTAKIWDALTGKCLYDMTGHTEPVCSACAAPDLKWLLTGSEDQTAKLWVVQRDAGTVGALFTLRGHTDTVNSVAFSDDLKFIVTGSSDKTAIIWSVRTGICMRTFEGHKKSVFKASFSPDGTRLQTWSQDSTSKVWEVETGRCTSTERLHDEQLLPAALSASDPHIVASAEGQDLKLRDRVGNKERWLEGHTDDITSVQFIQVHVPIRDHHAIAHAKMKASKCGSNANSPKNRHAAMNASRSNGFSTSPKSDKSLKSTLR